MYIKQKFLVFFTSLTLGIFFNFFYGEPGSIWNNITQALFFISLAVFIFSIITFFVKDYVWKVWIKFSLVFCFIFFFVIVFSPTDDGSFFLSSQELSSFGFLIFYIVTSIILIVYKSIKK